MQGHASNSGNIRDGEERKHVLQRRKNGIDEGAIDKISKLMKSKAKWRSMGKTIDPSHTQERKCAPLASPWILWSYVSSTLV